MKIGIEIMGLPFWRVEARITKDCIIFSCKDIDEFIQKDYERLKNDDIEIEQCLFGRCNG